MIKRVIICILVIPFVVFSQQVKTVKVPGDANIQKSGVEETFIRNLAEDEKIYQPLGMTVLNDFIYIGNGKPIEIVKLNLAGQTVVRQGREGRGPGEFVFCVSPKAVNGEIVFIDINNKIVFYTSELDFHKEIKLALIAGDFIVDQKGQFVFPRNARAEKYLGVYSNTGTLIKIFGDKKIDYRRPDTRDKVSSLAYDGEKNGIWAAFGNRYDLRYYENEEHKIEVVEKPGFFSEYKVKESGETEVTGKAIKLIVAENRLFYFYIKDRKNYCDIFNLADYKLLKRIELANSYTRFEHYKDMTFFALSFGANGDEDAQLFRIALPSIQ